MSFVNLQVGQQHKHKHQHPSKASNDSRPPFPLNCLAVDTGQDQQNGFDLSRRKEGRRRQGGKEATA